MKPCFGQSDAAMNKLAGCNKFENGAGSISNQKVLDGLKTIASLELQAKNEGFETPYEMLSARNGWTVGNKLVKRISPISYENGYEDGFEKGRMSMQPAKNMTEHMTPEPLSKGYYGHEDGCDCAVCESMHFSELAKQQVDAAWNKLLDDYKSATMRVEELEAEVDQVTQTAINFHDAWGKYRDALHIIAHMGISGLSWQHDFEKCVNIAREALAARP